MGKWNGLYVAHDCRNSRNPEYILLEKGNRKSAKPNPDYCNNRWIDKDLTGATTQIPTWKYCRKCCEKMGIDFDKQKPEDYRTEEQQERIKQHVKDMITKRQKSKSP